MGDCHPDPRSQIEVGGALDRIVFGNVKRATSL
jgi:hypothetical protein